MTTFQIASLLLGVAAVAAWVNGRFLRLPTTIGLMAMALVGSLGVVLVDAAGWIDVQSQVREWLAQARFSDTLLHGVLGLMLFAGAMHIDLGDLRRERVAIAVLAAGGTAASTFLVALGIHGALDLIGQPLAFAHCLVFGALISPTDPIAVLGILKTAKVPRSLENQIAGESLFNDGIGVVIFMAVLEVAVGGGEQTAGDVGLLFAREALGGAAFGLAFGWVGYRMLKSIDLYKVEVLITLALVTGGYALADAVHVSAPIGAVVAGLVIGNQGRSRAMSDMTREYVDKFWELIDEILNAVLFVFIGLEVMALDIGTAKVGLGVAAIAVTLAARFVTVALPVGLFRRRLGFARHAAIVLTWGGLRGGISVALALSLPAGPERDLVVDMTYAVVVFSILVQGLSLGPLLRFLHRHSPHTEAD